MTQQRTGITRTIELADVGMILRTTPEIVSDRQLKVFVEFEESTLVDTDVVIMESSDGTQSETAGGVDSVVMETVVKVRTGYPCLLTGTAARGTKRPSGHFLVICATVGDE
jgi:type II secretory pathway component GspD/PulD (secretin)